MWWDDWLPPGSWLRRVDVRVKGAWLLLAAGLAFFWEDGRLQAGLLAVMVAVALTAGLSRRYLLRMTAFLLPLMALSVLTQALFGEALLWRKLGRAPTVLLSLPEWLPWLGGHPLWREGMRYGLVIAAKTMTMALAAPLLFLSSGMDEVLAALLAMRLPYRLAFVFASAVHSFPLLFDEAREIVEAQRTRGLAPEELGLSAKVAFYGRIAVPLILGAMVRAQRMEMVLQAKGFSPDGRRTALHEVRLRRWEWAALIGAAMAGLVALVGYLRWGWGRFVG